jgi:5-bromo-4-chloroindolyl phosphate hydrolysis protein
MLVGAATAAVTAPILALGFDLPVWIDGAGAAGSFLVAYNWARQRPSKARLEEARLTQARYKTARALLAEGGAALIRLRRVGKAIRDRGMRRQIRDLYKTGQRVLAHVRADPAKAMSVRRVMTFYLPNAASVAEGWLSLERQASPSAQRAAQTRATVRDLNAAFAKFADDLAEPQLQVLDLDLKMLNDAMKVDLEKT